MPFTNVLIPIFESDRRLTARCTAAVRGRRFVAISGDIPGGMYGTENIRVAECGLGVKPVGVSNNDGLLNEEIGLTNDGAVVPMPAGAAITAGQQVQSDAQGRPIPWAGFDPAATTPQTGPNPAGIAVTSQATVDADVAIKLYR